MFLVLHYKLFGSTKHKDFIRANKKNTNVIMKGQIKHVYGLPCLTV